VRACSKNSCIGIIRHCIVCFLSYNFHLSGAFISAVFHIPTQLTRADGAEEGVEVAITASHLLDQAALEQEVT
jgi:hypothetical protein